MRPTSPQVRYSADALEGVRLKGRFHILQKVSHGGMAWVYRGVDLQTQRALAIKVLFAHLAHDPTARERFRLEAQYQSQWQHPNIVHVLDYVEEGGMVGMVMDWVEGPSLQQLFEQQSKPFTYPGMVALFLPLVEAIGYAHAHQVVHRDLKPSNILLQQLKHGFIPKVADFGIAKSLAPDGPMLTASNNVMGTVQYMAPEQILSSKHIDHRADIYSLGAILYQLVTGRMLFTARGMHQWAYLQRKVTPAAPSEYAPDVPRTLEFVIKRCLEKEPEKRYEDCAALRQALRATGLAVGADDTIYNVQGVEEPTRPMKIPSSALSRNAAAPSTPPQGASTWSGEQGQASSDGIPTRGLPSAMLAGLSDGPTLPAESVPELAQLLAQERAAEQTVEDEVLSLELLAQIESRGALSSVREESLTASPSQDALSAFPSRSEISPFGDEPTWSLFLYIGLFLCILGVGAVFLMRALDGSGGTSQRPSTKLANSCQDGERRSCYGGPPGTLKRGICQAGFQICEKGLYGPCREEIQPMPQELCNERDDNCDGRVDEDYLAKGQPCTISLGTCRFPGKQACRQDRLGLECQQIPVSPSDKVRRIRMSLLPAQISFVLYIQHKASRRKVRRIRASGDTCVETKGPVRMTLQAKGYESCSFPVRWHNQQLRVQLSKKSELYNAPHYCLQTEP